MSNYESWRISYQSSEAAARSAWQEMIHLHHRVNELEAQLSATHPTTQGLDAAVRELIDRLQDAQQDINLAANTHMSQQLASAAALLDEVESTLRALSATQPAAQGLELANCKGDKWLTVVYRDIQPGDESRTIGEHPKVSALSWSHALHDRDAALAAKAKQGGAA